MPKVECDGAGYLVEVHSDNRVTMIGHCKGCEKCRPKPKPMALRIDILAQPCHVPEGQGPLVTWQFCNDFGVWKTISATEKDIEGVRRDYLPRMVSHPTWDNPKLIYVESNQTEIFDALLKIGQDDLERVAQERALQLVMEKYLPLWMQSQQRHPWWKRIWRAWQKNYR